MERLIRKIPVILGLVCLLYACRSKEPLVQEELRLWEGRWVPKFCYDSLLKKHTADFVEGYFKNTTATDTLLTDPKSKK